MNEEQMEELAALLGSYESNADERKGELVPDLEAINEEFPLPPALYPVLSQQLAAIIQETSQPATPPVNAFEAVMSALKLGYERDKRIIEMLHALLSQNQSG